MGTCWPVLGGVSAEFRCVKGGGGRGLGIPRGGEAGVVGAKED